jgi:hypothetical protein
MTANSTQESQSATTHDIYAVEQPLRDFVNSVVEPSPEEWRQAWRRFTIIRQEYPVIHLCDKLVQAEAFEVLHHQNQVALTADIMGQRDGLPAQQLGQLNRAAQVHDVGKSDPEILEWTRSSEKYTGERLKAFLEVISRHSDLGVGLILAEDSGWNDEERGTVATIVWGHHDFKTVPRECYGVKPAETDPLFPAARDLAIADMAAAMTQVRAYKDALPRGITRQQLHEGSSVDNALIDQLLYGGSSSSNYDRAAA